MFGVYICSSFLCATIYCKMDNEDNKTTPTSKSQAHSVAHTTPSGRLEYSPKSLSSKDKKRVDSADAGLNHSCCLIQNYPNDPSVQYCHMVARKFAKKDDLMASLEWHWNMPYKSLHLNTRYNVFFAGPALHILHDNGAWGLLPDKTVIDRYLESLAGGRSQFPDIKQPTKGFEYRLIPLGKSMEQYPILRRNRYAVPPKEDQFTIHFHPYGTLPSFRSHLHPKFAIYELGRKFDELTRKNSAAAGAAASLCPDLHRIYFIYGIWKQAPEESHAFEEWKGPDDQGGDDDRQSATSSKTGYDSLRKGAKRRRTGNANEQGSPTPAGKNSDVMQMANPSFETLSHKTLIEHEHVYGKGGWTQDGLSSWAVDASRHVTS